MDKLALRKLLRPAIGDLKDRCTNSEILEFCAHLGLPVPDEVGAKRDRMHAAFDALSDDALPRFATSLLAKRLLAPSVRNAVQDIVWADEPAIEIPKRYRREIARALQRLDLFRHWANFSSLLQDTFIIPDDPLAFIFSGEDGFLKRIHKHFVRNPEDADVEKLFEDLQIFDITDRRFAKFLEGLTSSEVQVDVEAQLAIVTAMNQVLRTTGVELRQTNELGGYPVFGIVALRAVRGRPKNLIFASRCKPDIRFRDAVDNDIEIASSPDEVLVYDRPLGVDGLRWRELQEWWAEMTAEPDTDRAKKTLYRRLIGCLPESSPPQRLLFESFFRSFGAAVPALPALLPEVWLHWDPKTVAERGTHALLAHRMDFLMLMPGGGRIVIEVDGIQHYSDKTGRADPRQYARLTAGDRDLKLAGYEVYRFAGIELQGSASVKTVKHFFEALFRHRGISYQ